MKRIFALMLAALLLMSATGCQAAPKPQPSPEPEVAPAPVEEPSAVPSADPSPLSERSISQSGPYGTISVTIPESWDYEFHDAESDDLITGLYGIHLHSGRCPGTAEVCYHESFGVCGTGLVTEQVTLAGQPAEIGTYDDNDFWDYVAFQGDLEGIVVLRDQDCGTYWDEEQRSQLMEILDSVTFDREAREGCIGFFSPTAEADQIGVVLSLTHVTPNGGTLSWNLYDPELPTGELMYGEDFSLERLNGDQWQSVDVVIQGDWGFEDIAYTIAPDVETTKETDWSWLYGALSPGTYRIHKQVMVFRGSGDYDTYDLAACFIVN